MHIFTSFTAYFTLFHQGRFVFVSKNIFLVFYCFQNTLILKYNKPGNSCHIYEQFVPGSAGSLKVHKWKHQTVSQKLSLKDSFKVHIETKHKDKVKSDIDNKDKDKANSDTNSKNKQITNPFFDLFESDEEDVDEVDQLQVLLNSEVCEESNDEEYEEIDTNQRSPQKVQKINLKFMTMQHGYKTSINCMN